MQNNTHHPPSRPRPAARPAHPSSICCAAQSKWMMYHAEHKAYVNGRIKMKNKQTKPLELQRKPDVLRNLNPSPKINRGTRLEKMDGHENENTSSKITHENEHQMVTYQVHDGGPKIPRGQLLPIREIALLDNVVKCLVMVITCSHLYIYLAQIEIARSTSVKHTPATIRKVFCICLG